MIDRYTFCPQRIKYFNMFCILQALRMQTCPCMKHTCMNLHLTKQTCCSNPPQCFAQGHFGLVRCSEQAVVLPRFIIQCLGALEQGIEPLQRSSLRKEMLKIDFMKTVTRRGTKRKLRSGRDDGAVCDWNRGVIM